MTPAPRPARRRANVAVQLGQTLLVIGAAVLVVGLLIGADRGTIAIGAALLLAGVVLFVGGLRRRRVLARGPSGSVPPAPGPPGQ